MALFGTSVEYGLHTLVWLAADPAAQASSRDLADLQEVPPALLAKILSKLEKAGIVGSSGGISGGFRLGRPAEQISVLDVVDAIEGRKPLFDCMDIRERCALWEGRRPFPSGPICGIHAVMIHAERAMRDELAKTSIASLVRGAQAAAPPEFAREVQTWLAARTAARGEARIAGIRASAKARREKGQT